MLTVFGQLTNLDSVIFFFEKKTRVSGLTKMDLEWWNNVDEMAGNMGAIRGVKCAY